MQLNSKDNEIIRARYIKKVIINEIWKKWLTQEKVSELTGVNLNTLKQYIWWPRAKTDDEYYDLIFKEVLWFDEEKIKKIKLEAREQQIKAEFWSEIWIKTDTTGPEEVPFKVAFKREFWKELTENDKAILDRLFKENWM